MESNMQTENKENKAIPEDNIPLDMEEYGGLEITSGGSKPLFTNITKAKVTSAVLMTTKERKEDLDKKGNKLVFYPVYLKVVYDVAGKEVFENFGGGKLFISEEKKEKRMWIGDNSALGKLKTLLKKYDKDFKGVLGEMANLIQDKDVGILTDETNVAGTIYQKNLIEVIY